MRPGVSRSGLGQLRRLLIASALPLVATACGIGSDPDVGAYNGCLVRHPQDPLVCDGPLEAYRVDASDLPARAAVPVSRAVAAMKGAPP
jgi:hypothetical protein